MFSVTDPPQACTASRSGRPKVVRATMKIRQAPPVAPQTARAVHHGCGNSTPPVRVSTVAPGTDAPTMHT